MDLVFAMLLDHDRYTPSCALGSKMKMKGNRGCSNTLKVLKECILSVETEWSVLLSLCLWGSHVCPVIDLVFPCLVPTAAGQGYIPLSPWEKKCMNETRIMTYSAESILYSAQRNSMLWIMDTVTIMSSFSVFSHTRGTVVCSTECNRGISCAASQSLEEGLNKDIIGLLHFADFFFVYPLLKKLTKTD